MSGGGGARSMYAENTLRNVTGAVARRSRGSFRFSGTSVASDWGAQKTRKENKLGFTTLIDGTKTIIMVGFSDVVGRAREKKNRIEITQRNWLCTDT